MVDAYKPVFEIAYSNCCSIHTPGHDGSGQHVGTPCLWARFKGGEWQRLEKYRSQHQWLTALQNLLDISR